MVTSRASSCMGADHSPSPRGPRECVSRVEHQPSSHTAARQPDLNAGRRLQLPRPEGQQNLPERRRHVTGVGHRTGGPWSPRFMSQWVIHTRRLLLWALVYPSVEWARGCLFQRAWLSPDREQAAVAGAAQLPGPGWAEPLPGALSFHPFRP